VLKTLGVLIATSTFGLPLFGSAVLTTMCSVQTFSNPIMSNGTASCGLTGPDGTMKPGVTASSSFSESGLGTNTITATAGASVNPAVGSTSPVSFLSAAGTASATWTETFFTAGPVRPGTIQFTLNTDGNNQDGTSFAFAGIGTWSASLTNASPGICTGCGTFTMPFTLGATFTVELQAFDTNTADGNAVGGGEDSSSLAFSVFDVNGAPVAVNATPEPAALSYFGPGLVFLLIGVAAKRRGSRLPSTVCNR
jgi:hypothetical protein